MKNKNVVKLLCLLLLILISVLTRFHIVLTREKQYFPRFVYERNDAGLILRDTINKKDDTIFLFPRIKILPMDNNLVINNIQIRCLMPDPQSPNIGESHTFVPCDNYFDDLFIEYCIKTSVKLGEMLTRIPFVLEIEYVNYNGKRHCKRAYVFEYIQYYKEFVRIGYVGKTKLRKSRDEGFLKDLYNDFVTRSTTCPEMRKKGDVYTSCDVYHTSIDSTFSFIVYEE